jgi:hypothetical protein
MSRVFKAKFMSFLRKEYADGNLKFSGELHHLAHHTGFKLLVNDLYDKDWVVYCKNLLKIPARLSNI